MSESKTWRSLHDLEEYGLIFLTGESCYYGMRLLFDLTEQGRDLIAEYFGIPTSGFAKSWNSSRGQVASILLPSSMFTDLCEYIAYRVHDFDIFVVLPHECYACTDALWQKHERYKPFQHLEHKIRRNWRCETPQKDGRNVHTMTGRNV